MNMKQSASLFLLLSVLLVLSACKSSKPAVDSQPAEETIAAVESKSGSGMETGGDLLFFAANQRYSAEGKFEKWSFTKVDMEGDNVESLTASLEVDLTSVNEKSPKLTAHLKAPDFLFVDKFKTATIDLRNVKKTGADTYSVDMTLKMKDLIQEMQGSFQVTSKKPLHVKGEAKVDRILFGLGAPQMGVPNMIKVTFDTDVPVQ